MKYKITVRLRNKDELSWNAFNEGAFERLVAKIDARNRRRWLSRPPAMWTLYDDNLNVSFLLDDVVSVTMQCAASESRQ